MINNLLTEIKEGAQFDYLTVIRKSTTNNVICKCICGRRISVPINYLTNQQIKKHCGCGVSKSDLPNLYNLWKNMNTNEKSNWGTWKDFVIWSKQVGYSEIFSYYKKDRKLPYNKENLDFGIFINKKFFNIKRLKKNGISYNKVKKCFVASKRIKNIILSATEITKLLNKQNNNKHKILPENLFKSLK